MRSQTVNIHVTAGNCNVFYVKYWFEDDLNKSPNMFRYNL